MDALEEGKTREGHKVGAKRCLSGHLQFEWLTGGQDNMSHVIAVAKTENNEI